MEFSEGKKSLMERLKAKADVSLPAARRPKRKTKKRSPKESDVDLSRLDELSESELVAIARLVGHPNASRHLHRDDLIGLILGDADDCLDVLHLIRERIYQFVTGNDRIIRSQMKCDLHCPTCHHDEVVACFTFNRDLVE